MMGNYYGDMMGFGFGFGWIFMLIFWGLIIWAFLAVVRSISGHGCCGGHHGGGDKHKENGALGILKERYAKGEVSKEDFEKMKKDL